MQRRESNTHTHRGLGFGFGLGFRVCAGAFSRIFQKLPNQNSKNKMMLAIKIFFFLAATLFVCAHTEEQRHPCQDTRDKYAVLDEQFRNAMMEGFRDRFYRGDTEALSKLDHVLQEHTAELRRMIEDCEAAVKQEDGGLASEPGDMWTILHMAGEETARKDQELYDLRQELDDVKQENEEMKAGIEIVEEALQTMSDDLHRLYNQSFFHALTITDIDDNDILYVIVGFPLIFIIVCCGAAVFAYIEKNRNKNDN